MDQRHENVAVCDPSGTGKTFLLEALGQATVEPGRHVAWFTLEQLDVLIRAHRADDSVTKAIGRILRADLVVVDDIGLPVALTLPKGSTALSMPPTKNAVSRSAPTFTRPAPMS
jgi:DNA replication protein DnaC